MLSRSAFAAPILVALAAGPSTAQEHDVALPSGDTSSLFWTQEQRIVGFRNFDTIYQTRPIDNGTEALALVDDPQDFTGLTYEVEGTSHTLEDYLAAKVWRPFMEHPASWSISSGGELGGCCIHATLRDYARLGRFALRGGVLPDGTPTLPDGWILESTTGSKGNPGYGYLWWLWDGGAYAAIGIFGQLIWIDPRQDVVIVTQSAAPAATSGVQSAHRGALIEALYRHVTASS